ncbi:MAG: DMT family transporter [Gammaproteobacteria bacterium]|jgi:drug/metabolite transporter (DMT)-like permease|nr:DMT family transporter [Gammaproteobacteria bacterium]MBT5548382.1 DMT family transporter [Gammaproteobacteria bacterium]MBT7390074.1 DMT family transporter [Gammaproteobacteria bacterium]MBT8008491.1 DMT family transporter [Gammaproteobacteria bacterium]
MSISTSIESTDNKTTIVKSNFLCVFSILLFATGFPAAEYLLKDWDVVSVITARNVFSFILIFIIWLFIEGIQKVKSAKWLKGFLIGLSGFGIGAFLILMLQSLTTPVIAALAVATMPVFAVSLEMLLDGRKMTLWFFFGVVLVLVGGYIASGASLREDNVGIAALIGIIGVALFAWGSRATVKSLPGMSNLGQTAVTSSGMAGLSIFLYFVCSVFFDLTNATSIITIEHLGLVLIYAWLGLGISQIFWIKAVSQLGIGLASFHLNAVPFYVMFMLFLLGDSWIWHQAFGALIVISGVILAQQKSSKKKAEFFELP